MPTNSEGPRTYLEGLAQAIIEGDAARAEGLVQAALDGGVEALALIEGGLIPGMDVVGTRFKEGVVFVPEVLVAAQAMQAVLGMLRPLLADRQVPSPGVVVLGTVKEDIHDIGKNLVRIFLEGAGFRVIDLGKNVPEEAFVAAAREHQPDLVGLSCLLTTTMKWMRSTIVALGEAGLREGVRVMVGGAPITQRFADDIGADAYAPDGRTAVEKARALVGLLGKGPPET